MALTEDEFSFNIQVKSSIFVTLLFIISVGLIVIQVYIQQVSTIQIYLLLIIAGLGSWKLGSYFIKRFILRSFEWWKRKYISDTTRERQFGDDTFSVGSPTAFYLRYLLLRVLGINSDPSQRYFIMPQVLDSQKPFYRILLERVVDVISATLSMTFLILAGLQFVSRDFTSIRTLAGLIIQISLVSIILIALFTPIIWITHDARIGVISDGRFELLEDRLRSTFLERFIGFSGIIIGYTFLSEFVNLQYSTSDLSLQSFLWIFRTYLSILLVIIGPLMLLSILYFLIGYRRSINRFHGQLSDIIPLMEIELIDPDSSRPLEDVYDQQFLASLGSDLVPTNEVGQEAPVELSARSDTDNIACAQCEYVQTGDNKFCTRCGADFSIQSNWKTESQQPDLIIDRQNPNSIFRLILGEILLIIAIFNLSFISSLIGYVTSLFFPDVDSIFRGDDWILAVDIVFSNVVIVFLVAHYIRFGTIVPFARSRLIFPAFSELKRLLLRFKGIIQGVSLVISILIGLVLLSIFQENLFQGDLLSSAEQFRRIWLLIVNGIVVGYIVLRIFAYLNLFEIERDHVGDRDGDKWDKLKLVMLFVGSGVITLLQLNNLLIYDTFVQYVAENYRLILLIDGFYLASLVISVLLLWFMLPLLFNRLVVRNIRQYRGSTNDQPDSSEPNFLRKRLKKVFGTAIEEDTQYVFKINRINWKKLSNLVRKSIESLLVAYLLSLIVGASVRFVIENSSIAVPPRYEYFTQTQFFILVCLPIAIAFLSLFWTLEQIPIMGLTKSSTVVYYDTNLKGGLIGKYLGYGLIFIIIELILRGIDPLWQDLGITEYTYYLLLITIVIVTVVNFVSIFLLPLLLVTIYYAVIFPKLEQNFVADLKQRTNLEEKDLLLMGSHKI